MARGRAKARPPLVYVDTCIFLHVIKREKGWWPAALKTLLAAERGDIRMMASTLLLAEVASHKGDTDSVERDKVIDRYLMNSPVQWWEVDLFIAEDARRLCDPYKLRGADAVHLATAARANADYFVSNDLDFPLGDTVGTIKVIRPTLLWDPTLDDAQVDLDAANNP